MELQGPGRIVAFQWSKKSILKNYDDDDDGDDHNDGDVADKAIQLNPEWYDDSGFDDDSEYESNDDKFSDGYIEYCVWRSEIAVAKTEHKWFQSIFRNSRLNNREVRFVDKRTIQMIVRHALVFILRVWLKFVKFGREKICSCGFHESWN